MNPLALSLMLVLGVGVGDGVGRDHPTYGVRVLAESPHVYSDTRVIHRPKLDVGDGWAIEENAYVGDGVFVGMRYRYQHTSAYSKHFLFPSAMVRGVYDHIDLYAHGPEVLSGGSKWGAGLEFYTQAGHAQVRLGGGYTELNDAWHVDASVGYTFGNLEDR